MLRSCTQMRVCVCKGPRACPRGSVRASATAITTNTSLEDIPTPEAVAPLFKPVQVGRFQLATRAVYAPLTRCRAIGAIPVEESAQYYSERTNRGQLIITEATGVNESTTGYGYPNTPGLHTEEQTDAWKPIVRAVHAKSGVFFAQLWHTGRASHPAYHNGAQPVSSSDLPIPDGEIFHPTTFEAIPYNTIIPRPLETDEVPTYVEYFRSAARNAMEAGFDGIEIHATNGYLINQFLEDGINKRTDKYGGSIENRCRFCLDIVKAISEEVGSDRLGIRLGPFTGFLGAHDSDPYSLYGYLVDKLNDHQLAYMHFIEPRVVGNDDKVAAKQDSLEPFRKKCKTKFMAAGGYIDHDGRLKGAAEAIASGHADLIVFGRWALANPDLLKRIKLGAPLNKYDRATFYAPDPVKGYTDYPFLQDTEHAKRFFDNLS